MVWFNYQRTPLGVVVRVSKAAIYDLIPDTQCKDISLRDLDSIECIDLNDTGKLMRILYMDPDIADIIHIFKKSNRKLAILVLKWY